MDDRYAIRLAKTKLRDAYSKGDDNGVLSVFGDGYSDMSAGLASFYGGEARLVLKHRLKRLFARYKAQLAVTIISIQVQGLLAFDWGWHQVTLTPKKGGKSITKRTRYLEIWQKGADERWKIAIFFDNLDVPPQMPPKEVLAEMRGSDLRWYDPAFTAEDLENTTQGVRKEEKVKIVTFPSFRYQTDRRILALSLVRRSREGLITEKFVSGKNGWSAATS